MTHVMSSSETLSKTRIPNRFSASAPNLSSTSDEGTRPISEQQSHSVSQSQDFLPLPPLIFVTPFDPSSSRLDSSESLNVDPRLLTTSHSDSSGISCSSVTSTPIGENLNVVMNSESSDPQPQPLTQHTNQHSPRTMEEVVVLSEALSHRIQELRGALSRSQRRARGITFRGCYDAFRGLFGYGPEGTRARKEIVSLVTKLVFGLVQVSIIIVMLALAGAQKSPVDHTVNEWQACHRPLGVWSALWCVRVVLGSFVAIWMYRHRSTRLVDARTQRNNTQPETSTQITNDVAVNDRPPPTDNLPNDSLNINANNDTSALQHRNNSRIARLGSVLSLASAVWFIVAHALLYTSTTTCRLSAPHLWWLAFGIVCIGYVVVVELIAVVLTINLILICLGREPLQAASSHSKVGKLSVKAVDSIPLVLYIPAPTSKDTDPDPPPKTENDDPISKPEAAHIHSYPPQRECPSPSSMRSTGTRVHSRRSKRWFTFRRLSSKKDGDQDSEKPRLKNGDPYEEKWEKGEYPFVKLEENRAVCAICLCDFEEPKRIRYSIGSMPPLDQEEKAMGGGDGDYGPTPVDEEDALRLADAGGGSQPLRLLDCAHVFHKTCIDPWLTGVSGRCPVCQKPVEIKESKKSKRQRQDLTTACKVAFKSPLVTSRESNLIQPSALHVHQLQSPAVRLLAASVVPLHEFLRDDQQLSSPLTNFSRLREGVFLFKHGVDPYSGGVFRHSPILLAFFSTFLPLSSLLASILWTLFDAVGAWCLSQVWILRSGLMNSSRASLITAIYLLNPYLFLPSLALSTSSLNNNLFILALYTASLGNVPLSLLCLAFLSHMSISYALLLLPFSMLLLAGPSSRLAKPIAFTGLKRLIPIASEYITYMGILFLISTFMADGTSWVKRTWGAELTLPDLNPNPGLWWYFFTEMFDHFRSFFLMTFSMHLLIYVLPICIKFQHDPLYATFIVQGLLSIFKAYPTLSDIGLFLTVIALFPEVYPYLKTPIVTTLLHLHASLLLPLFNRLWLIQGTGNANFFYASTLVFGLANGFALVDVVWAGLRIAFGTVKEGWELAQK
ncbi:hypothetical protein Clacol_000711 [Clathrus columnatus]|uniref:RING-type domain-containing protein n=1 Tax=Clathrus columnatus TaxID=1419009 RepID=A0AAV5A1B9_9AGAM|nr:hypothetical protein Clacol_000711 [Clathrus columnatus]